MYKKIKNFEYGKTGFSIETISGKKFSGSFDENSAKELLKNNGIIDTENLTLRHRTNWLEIFVRNSDNSFLETNMIFCMYFPRDVIKSIQTSMRKEMVFNLNHRKHLRNKYEIKTICLAEIIPNELTESRIEKYETIARANCVKSPPEILVNYDGEMHVTIKEKSNIIYRD
jgi:hypothetical protein